MLRVCFVCLGNICRSPTAEAVFVKFVHEAGLLEQFDIDSAGTAGYHAGELADSRSRAAAKRRGYAITHRARQFQRSDFAQFDLVCAMDNDNLQALELLAPNDTARSKVRLLRSFDPEAPKGAEVPDPYYGGERGFDDVIEICERACRGLLEQAKAGQVGERE
ncbi:MAG TPA: low molecular weight protein-tyrosine-phosphatase [Polyangiaceae bacterium]